MDRNKPAVRKGTFNEWCRGSRQNPTETAGGSLRKPGRKRMQDVLCGSQAGHTTMRCQDVQGHPGKHEYRSHDGSMTHRWSNDPDPVQAWRDIHGDVWTLHEDGLLWTPETQPFTFEHVQKKWGPLVPVHEEPRTPEEEHQHVQMMIASIADIQQVLADHPALTTGAGWKGSPDPTDWHNIEPMCRGCRVRLNVPLGRHEGVEGREAMQEHQATKIAERILG